MKRVLILALSLNLIFVNPAAALFGSECKNPKSAYTKVNAELLQEKKAFLKYEVEQRSLMRFYTKAEIQEGYSDCLSNKTLFKISKSQCKYMWVIRPRDRMCFDDRCGELFDLISTVDKKIANLEIKKDLIVIQNSKCFDAGLVADSQMRQNR